MAHTIKDKKRLLARVKRIKGQAEALENALQKEVPCLAILQQIAAIRGAINGLMSAVIEGHLIDHIVKEPEITQRQENTDEILQIIKSYLK